MGEPTFDPDAAATRIKPTVVLTDAEAYALAMRLTARHLDTEWLEWEDVPWLGEQTFEVVAEAVGQVASNLLTLSKGYDAAHDIDSADILSRVLD